MSFVRYATARAVFEAFPDLSRTIKIEPTEQPPIDFVRSLVTAGKFPEVVAFCAHLLPRREAVWWACVSARTLTEEIARTRPPGLLAAEAWVFQPDTENRQRALDIGERSDENDPTTWLARAAAWSGGTQNIGGQTTPMPPYMTARASRIAILLSASRIRSHERTPRLRTCIAEAIRLAQQGFG
jgi:hypothetical protein